MGNSIGPPSNLGSAKINHGASGIEITVSDRSGKMIHSLAVNGLQAEYPVAYQVGAGKIGHTYVVRVGNYLYESPASWYRQHGWDVSPGYQTMRTVDFDRVVESACIFCHADNGTFLGSDQRRFSGALLKPIGCERCHGPADEHVRQPTAKNISNPAKLPRRARESICEQCHLEGETRVLNPGKTWQDFRPGDEFENTAATYLLSQSGHAVRAVGQVEQLAESKCVRASGGKLWCGSCHDPHGEASNRTRQIREICTTCHATLSKPVHAAVTECVSCHMPRLSPDDIPHAASTDHRILRRPAPLLNANTGEPEISAWQEPPAQYRQRDLAVAGMIVGSQHALAPVRDKAVKLLESLPEDLKNNDPAVISSLIAIRFQQREGDKAKALARRATEVQPDSGFASLNLALALENAGDNAASEKQYLHTIDLDPSLQGAWTNLVFMYDRMGRQADKSALIKRFLQWNPESIWFRQLRAMTSAER